jgi:hypothetical protein
MAWVDYKRLPSKLKGAYGEPMVLTAQWEIRVDDPDTSEADILAGVSGTIGITWGTAHWGITSLKAMDFDLSPSDRTGMIWTLTVTYTVPPPRKRITENGKPEDVWERSGGTTTVPAFEDIDGNLVQNAAGDPLEGLERERDERGWTLTKFYDDDADLEADVDAYAGHVNDAEWADGAAKTWKAYFLGAKKVTISKLDGDADGGDLEFVEARWEFRYDPETWTSKPWDMGFHELDGSGGKKAIVMDDGKAVKQPVGLNADGTARDPSAVPALLVANGGDGFEFYPDADFTTGFSAPEMVP